MRSSTGVSTDNAMTRTTLSTLTSLRILIPLILILAAVAIFLNRIKIQAKAHGQQKTTAITVLTAALLGIYLLIYFYLTFGYRRPSRTASISLTPFWSYREAFQLNPLSIRRLGMARQILLNILLTIPAGLLLPILYSRTRHPYLLAIATVLALALLTETFQYVTHLGLCETDDVINNLLGGLLGIGVLRLGSITKRRQSGTNRLDPGVPGGEYGEREENEQRNRICSSDHQGKQQTDPV